MRSRFPLRVLFGACLIATPAPAAPLAVPNLPMPPIASRCWCKCSIRRSGGGHRRWWRLGDGGAVAAGVIGGLLLGAIIANEAQRQQAVSYARAAIAATGSGQPDLPRPRRPPVSYAPKLDPGLSKPGGTPTDLCAKAAALNSPPMSVRPLPIRRPRAALISVAAWWERWA